MPMYDYHCVVCGDFRAMRPMAQSGSASACPTCGAASARVIAAPFLGGRDSGAGAAPRQSGRGGFPRVCGHGHGCSHSHGH